MVHQLDNLGVLPSDLSIKVEPGTCKTQMLIELKRSKISTQQKRESLYSGLSIRPSISTSVQLGTGNICHHVPKNLHTVHGLMIIPRSQTFHGNRIDILYT